MSELLRGKSDLEAEIARCDREIERCRAACAVDKHAAIGECDWRAERNILLEQTEASKERMGFAQGETDVPKGLPRTPGDRYRFKRKQCLRTLLKYHGNLCWICDFPMLIPERGDGKSGHDLAVTIDHVQARSIGGSPNDIVNMRLAHKLCNMTRRKDDVTDELRLVLRQQIEQLIRDSRGGPK